MNAFFEAPSHEPSHATSFEMMPTPQPLPRQLESRKIRASKPKVSWQQEDRTVAMVGPQPPTWEPVRKLIDSAKGLSCSATFADTETARIQLRKHRPEVLLMNLSLLRLEGAGCIPSLREHSPRLKILVLTNGEDDKEILAALRAGANGFVLNRNLAADLVPAIRQVVAGETPMSSDVTAGVAAFFRQQGKSCSAIDNLSPRLRQVLDYLSRGRLYKEIADELGITYDTVNSYTKVIYERLQVHSRAEAVLKYLGR